MSLIDKHKTAHTVTTEYLITPAEILAWIATDLGVPPEKIKLTWEIDDGLDYNGKYARAPVLKGIKIKVTNA